jgi:hypothetical protein
MGNATRTFVNDEVVGAVKSYLKDGDLLIISDLLYMRGFDYRC